MPHKGSRSGQLNIIERAASSYSTLGIFLLDDDYGHQVKGISMAEHYKPDVIMKEIFLKWLQTAKDPSWTTLIKCLRTIELNTLARDIEQALAQNGLYI